MQSMNVSERGINLRLVDTHVTVCRFILACFCQWCVWHHADIVSYQLNQFNATILPAKHGERNCLYCESGPGDESLWAEFKVKSLSRRIKTEDLGKTIQ